jgi:hypothetical protein
MSGNFVEDAKTEVSGMAKQGMRHPSTKPVLVAAAAGAVVGALTPLSVVAGVVIGAGIMFYKRVRP